MSLGLRLSLLYQGFLLLQLDAAWTHKLLTLQVCNHSLLSLESHMKPISLGIDWRPLPSCLNCLKASRPLFPWPSTPDTRRWAELQRAASQMSSFPSSPCEGPASSLLSELWVWFQVFLLLHPRLSTVWCPDAWVWDSNWCDLLRELTTLLVICDVLMWIWVCTCTCTCVQVCVCSINSSRSVLSKTAASSHI